MIKCECFKSDARRNLLGLKLCNFLRTAFESFVFVMQEKDEDLSPP